MKEFKTLEFPFQKNGWTHECLERKGLVVLVRRHKNGFSEHFEVIRLRQRPEATFVRADQEIHVPAREVYPSDEDWGTYGFTFSANSHTDPLASAQNKMQLLARSLMRR